MTGVSPDIAIAPISMFERAKRSGPKFFYKLRTPISEIIFAGLLMAIIQLADGLLTAFGVLQHGLLAEGNPFIRALMVHLGVGPALFVVKALAILIVYYLCILARKMPWICGALRCISVLYLVAAIVPWTAILLVY